MAGSASKGCHDLAPSFDTCGYFTRDGATFVRVGEVLLGEDSDPLPQSPRYSWREMPLPFSTRTCGRRLRRPCARLRRVGPTEEVEAATEGFTALYWAMRYIQSREAWTVDGPMIERYHPPLGPAWPTGSFSKAVTDAQVAEAQVIRAAFRSGSARFSGTMRC